MSGSLKRVAEYSVKNKNFVIVLSQGSVLDFRNPPKIKKSAIVNAANEGCLGGGGVDGAIGDAGGKELLKHRIALPLVKNESGDLVRCPTGEAKMTGPGDYGSLRVKYVIHAVGPSYITFSDDIKRGDDLLRSAYRESLQCAKSSQLEAVAFSLLSSGVFRGPCSLEYVLNNGLQAICDYPGYEGLKEIHMCAFSSRELDSLQDVAEVMMKDGILAEIK
jgi:O-acetyl-ADP-ribose deacetylase (regulator of RNase III)